MFSKEISNGWFIPDRNSSAYLHATTHVETLLEALNVSISFIETPEQVGETVNELTTTFLERFDTSPSNPTNRLDPFLMALNCDYILSWLPIETAASPRLRIKTDLIAKIRERLYVYCHISTTSKFVEQCENVGQCSRDLAFAMISHTRLGHGLVLSSGVGVDVIHIICKYTDIGLKTQGGQRKFISDSERGRYLDFVESVTELRDPFKDTVSAWGIFRQRFT